jgi:hypothetical protein
LDELRNNIVNDHATLSFDPMLIKVVFDRFDRVDSIKEEPNGWVTSSVEV